MMIMALRVPPVQAERDPQPPGTSMNLPGTASRETRREAANIEVPRQWMPLDEQLLISYLKEQKTWTWIAQKLRRSEGDVKKHCTQMRLQPSGDVNSKRQGRRPRL